jgi:hypothetical protein
LRGFCRAASLRRDGALALLGSAQIEAADAWRIAALLGAAVRDRHGAGTARRKIRRTAPSDASSQEGPLSRSEDFARLRLLRAMGEEIEPTSLLALLDRDSHLDARSEEVPAVEELDLNGAVHAFLLSESEMSAVFERGRSLCFFDAHALTSEGLDALLRAMPSLAHLRLVNNYNPTMTHLCARSARVAGAHSLSSAVSSTLSTENQR